MKSTYVVKIICGNCHHGMLITQSKGTPLPDRIKCVECECETHTNYVIGLMPEIIDDDKDAHVGTATYYQQQVET